MKKVLILGANGQIARLVIPRLLQETDVHLTLYLRKSTRLQSLVCITKCQESLVVGWKKVSVQTLWMILVAQRKSLKSLLLITPFCALLT